MRILARLLAVLALAAAASAVRAETRHVIVMVCDGWGYTQLDAAAHWHGERYAFEDSAWTGLALSTGMYHRGTESPPYGSGGFVGVYGYDPDAAWTDWAYAQDFATDSAAAATALSTGFKTYRGSIGMSAGGPPAPLRHAFEHAASLGRATGVVTSVQASHATPAAFAVHNVSRGNYAEIARALIAGKLDVVLGAGHPDFDDDGSYDPGDPVVAADWRYVGGYASWLDLQAGRAGGLEPWTLVEDPSDFATLADWSVTPPPRVFGVARVARTLQFGRSGAPGANSDRPPYVTPFLPRVPTLAEMARGALNVLMRDPDGFCLMIEGGAVDWAGHERQLGRLIEELDGFAAAVDAVAEWVETYSDWTETMVVITGDHETGMLWGDGVDPGDPATWFAPLVDNGPGVMPGFRFHSTGHTNQLIPIFARGAGAERLLAAADGADPVRGAYLDNTDVGKTLFYVLDGTEVDAGEPATVLAARPWLDAARPNPFNPSTTLAFRLAADGPVALRVIDPAGRVVRTLLAAHLPAGDHRLDWDGADDVGRPCASGAYLAVLEVGAAVSTRKLSLVR